MQTRMSGTGYPSPPSPADEVSNSSGRRRQHLLQAATSLRNMYRDLREVHETLLQHLEQSQRSEERNPFQPDHEAIILTGEDPEYSPAPVQDASTNALEHAMARLVMFESRNPPTSTPSRASSRIRTDSPGSSIPRPRRYQDVMGRRIPSRTSEYNAVDMQAPIRRPTAPRVLPSRTPDYISEDLSSTSIGRAVARREAATASLPSPTPSSLESPSYSTFLPSEESLRRANYHIQYRRSDPTSDAVRRDFQATVARRSADNTLPVQQGSAGAAAARRARWISRMREHREASSQSAGTRLSTLSNFSVQNLSIPSILSPDQALLFEEPEPMNDTESLDGQPSSSGSSYNIRRTLDNNGEEHVHQIDNLVNWGLTEVVDVGERVQSWAESRAAPLDVYQRLRQAQTNGASLFFSFSDNGTLKTCFLGDAPAEFEGVGVITTAEERSFTDGLRERVRQRRALNSTTRDPSLNETDPASPRVRLNRTANIQDLFVSLDALDGGATDEDSLEPEYYGRREPFRPRVLPLPLVERRQKPAHIPNTLLLRNSMSASLAGR